MATSLRVRLGFRDGARGTHGSRSILLEDLRLLLDACPLGANRAEYRHAVLEGNVIGRKTSQTRDVTLQKLTELYGLDPDLPVFRGLRRCWDIDGPGRPLLALLCASARDPLLRLSAPIVLARSLGTPVSSHDFAALLHERLAGRLSDKTLLACSRRLASSWSQAGYLSMGLKKLRSRPVVTPPSAAYAMFLGYLEGLHGQRLTQSTWGDLLSESQEERLVMISAAARQGILEYKAIGTVIELRFSDWLTREEQELLREQDRPPAATL